MYTDRTTCKAYYGRFSNDAIQEQHQEERITRKGKANIKVLNKLTLQHALSLADIL